MKTEVQRRASKGLREVRSGRRPDIKEAIRRVLGDKAMSIGDLMDGLKHNGWLPASNNPRNYVSGICSQSPDFRWVSRGVYRVNKSAAKTNGTTHNGATEAPTQGEPQIQLTLPIEYARGLQLLAAIEDRPVHDIILEVVVATLRQRINAALDGVKIKTMADIKPIAKAD